jgi:hypothetical protein
LIYKSAGQLNLLFFFSFQNNKMSIQALPFVSVQADWDDVVREVASNTIAEGSFWIACYLTG